MGKESAETNEPVGTQSSVYIDGAREQGTGEVDTDQQGYLPETWPGKGPPTAVSDQIPGAEADDPELEMVQVVADERSGGPENASTTALVTVPTAGVYFHLTDLGNALRLVGYYGQDIFYCHLWRKWLEWDGRRWIVDNSGAIFTIAKQTVARIYGETARLIAEAAKEMDADQRVLKARIADPLLDWAKRSESLARIEAMVKLAQSEVLVTPDQLDTDPWLLNVLNGTLDLRSGELREHRREDLITKLAPVEYDANATCPTWEAFLDIIMGGNANLISFLQRAVGYALTGDVSEQVMFIFYGAGSNGKSTFLIMIMHILGDYAVKAAPELLMVKHGEAHPTEKVDLFGRRFVAAIETEDGRAFAEVFVKEATGGDPIRARRMREDFWQFLPTHKIFLATNHRPVVKGTDHAIWRRLKLIPFNVTTEEDKADKGLLTKLRSEAPGILAWAVRGALLWQRDGLAIPDEVRNATQEYRQDMDALGQFLADRCYVLPTAVVLSGNLYAGYRDWCQHEGEPVMTQVMLGRRLRERGFTRGRAGHGGPRVWYGLTLAVYVSPSVPGMTDGGTRSAINLDNLTF